MAELRKRYKMLEPVFCPYLNQKVFFTLVGFKHLIWKKKTRRDYCVIQKRFASLGVVPEIISHSGTLQEYELDKKEFFAFIAIMNGRKYKVVIFKGGDGIYRFLSIIPNWRTGKRDIQKHT